ncbi:MAG: signal peptidase II, partial [Paludibacteraceae bacterium]|nr:signal peptidase II [Paludibacteraceae bacterium]
MKKPLIVIFLVLLLDQFSKIMVKTTMAIGEAIPVFGKWFYILFIENNGMAFGWEISGAKWGKIFLCLFRIAAVIFLIWLLFKLVKKKVKFGPLFGISLIIA